MMRLFRHNLNDVTFKRCDFLYVWLDQAEAGKVILERPIMSSEKHGNLEGIII